LLALTLFAASAWAEPGAAFDPLLDGYWYDWLALNPALALSVGGGSITGAPSAGAAAIGAQVKFDDSLEDAWRVRMLALLDGYSRAMAGVDPASLSAQQRLSRQMLLDQLAQAREFYGGAAFITARRLPIDPFQGGHLRFAADAAGAGDYPFKTLADYEQALRRADRFERWSREVIGRLREGVANGVVLPRSVVLRMLPQLQEHFGKAPELTDFWRPLAHPPAAFSAADRHRLEAAYRHEIAAVIEPAYRHLYEYLSRVYLPAARASDGLGAIPGGRELYEYDVRYHTTTTLSSAQIHALGLREVTRIEAQLEGVKSELGFAGTLPEFYAHVRADAAQKFASRSEIIPAYQAARRRIEARLPMLFDVMPRAAFEIRALPDYAQSSQGNGNYAPAAGDGSRPGILWINTFAPGVSDRFNVMTITLHEGLPGHHLQTSLAGERTDLPAFRRFDSTTAYVEGWALYAESLGPEMGVFDDPWSRYGNLNYAILRANRLVIDTGLHAMGWSVAEGVGWMMQHSSMTRPQSLAEVERYAAYPGQALAYKIGELKIRELRTRAEQAQGARFDLKAFHDTILLGGSMPLTLLERQVDDWIATPSAR
jgi:uncharacterized protein (DUF885 family)